MSDIFGNSANVVSAAFSLSGRGHMFRQLNHLLILHLIDSLLAMFPGASCSDWPGDHCDSRCNNGKGLHLRKTRRGKPENDPNGLE
jgi:hypothetical protein